MTGASEARVTQRAEEVAEEVASAANIVTNAGYYEIDIDAVTAVIARFEAEVTQSATAPLIEAIEAAERDLQWIAEFTAKRLKGTDDWFDLTEVNMVAGNRLTRLADALATHKGEDA